MARVALGDSAHPDGNVVAMRRLILATEAAMREWHIRGRIEALGPTTFAAIAIAIPTDGEGMRRKEAICRTRTQAVEKLRKLAVELGAELRAEGDEILEVQTDD
jgi:hypothetical protein